jgi:hypothetical protein
MKTKIVAMALVLMSLLSVAPCGCGTCPLAQFDTNGDRQVSEEEMEAAGDAYWPAACAAATDLNVIFSCSDYCRSAPCGCLFLQLQMFEP